MRLTRREMLLGCVGAVPALTSGADAPERPRMGVVIHSYGARRFGDPLAFLRHCHSIGAGGAQISIGTRDEKYAAEVRQYLEENKLYLEGSIRLPRDEAGVERFTAEVRSARECGATVLRTAMLSGRRYETFDSAKAFREFAARGWQSLVLAEPVVRKHKLRLAVENHKDWRVEDLLGMLRRIDSEHVGVCVDTGNSIALLEGPLEVVKAYAPWAFSTHIKDMGVREYEDGFLLSEVPLGTGFLDMPKVIETLRAARPEVRFNLEMITRDPLRVPCLTEKYWATFPDLPGRHLAASLRMVRKHTAKELPHVSMLSRAERLKVEAENVRQSLQYAREKLGL